MTNEARLGTATPDDKTRWQTPQRAFDLYAQRSAVAAGAPDVAIVPQPAVVQRPGGAPLDLSHGVRLSLAGLQRQSIAAALADLASAGVRTGVSGPALRVTISRSRALPSGSVSPRWRRAAASTSRRVTPPAPALRLESLAQQAASEHGQLRPLVIEDSPQFGFRGLHIDLARNFHSKAEVLKVIEQMGRYKLNKLHLHLGDDEGWRLEIARFPELTQVGGYRCYDPGETHCLLPQLGSGPDRDTASQRLSHPSRLYRDPQGREGARDRGDPVIRHAGSLASGDPLDGSPLPPAAGRRPQGGRRAVPARRTRRHDAISQHPELQRQHAKRLPRQHLSLHRRGHRRHRRASRCGRSPAQDLSYRRRRNRGRVVRLTGVPGADGEDRPHRRQARPDVHRAGVGLSCPQAHHRRRLERRPRSCRIRPRCQPRSSRTSGATSSPLLRRKRTAPRTSAGRR